MPNHLLKKLLLLPLLLWSFAASAGKDPDLDKQNLSKEEITNIIKNASNLKSKEIDKVINVLTEKFGTDHEGKLRISGVLTSSGLNFSIIKDRKFWHFDASFIPDDTDTLVQVPKLYKVEFFNGGFKIELAYKWVFLFTPANVDVEALDGSTYGRGVAASLPILPSLALEGGWMPGDKMPGNMFFLAPLVGIGGGSLTFPKMKFEINPQAKK